MPTFLGKKFSVDWRGRPPHMLSPDIPVWYRFLEKYGHLFNELYYDCFVGGEYHTREELQDPITKMWWANTAKRLDAFAVLENEVWIIEVSRHPGFRALGQLQSYRFLYLEDPKFDKIEKVVLVLELIDTDIIAPAAAYGVACYVMPAEPGKEDWYSLTP
ncbi:MAG: hypothetical protein JRI34_04895 [Deltaproteobacteria bacterium]|nr:hypothetical protein [Deltaproteobacteria bacterium]